MGRKVGTVFPDDKRVPPQNKRVVEWRFYELFLINFKKKAVAFGFRSPLRWIEFLAFKEVKENLVTEQDVEDFLAFKKKNKNIPYTEWKI